MSIAMKMVKVMAAVERVAKTGRNEFHKYDYVTEADLVEEIRSALSANGVAFLPTCKSIQQEADITRAEMEFHFIDSEDGTEMVSTFWGVGQDKGDKGAYKAYTGAVKYALMKTFLVPTGDADDPEHDGKTPPKRSQAPQRPAPLKPAPKASTATDTLHDMRQTTAAHEQHLKEQGSVPPNGGASDTPTTADQAQVDTIFTERRRRQNGWLPIMAAMEAKGQDMEPVKAMTKGAEVEQYIEPYLLQLTRAEAEVVLKQVKALPFKSAAPKEKEAASA